MSNQAPEGNSGESRPSGDAEDLGRTDAFGAEEEARLLTLGVIVPDEETRKKLEKLHNDKRRHLDNIIRDGK